MGRCTSTGSRSSPHGLRPVRLGVPAEPRRRREPLHGQRLQHAVGAARRAARPRGLRDPRGLEGRRRRPRLDRLVPPRRSRPVHAAGSAAVPSALAAVAPRDVPDAQRPRLQRLGRTAVRARRLPRLHRPRGRDRSRPLPDAGLVPARRVPRRLRGAARTRGARRPARDLPVDRGRTDGVLQGRPELDPTPLTVRAETWLAIAGGARGSATSRTTGVPTSRLRSRA